MTEMSVRQWQGGVRAGGFFSEDRGGQCEGGGDGWVW